MRTFFNFVEEKDAAFLEQFDAKKREIDAKNREVKAKESEFKWAKKEAQAKADAAKKH